MVYELKTQINDASVKDFLNTIEDEQKKEDSFKLLDIFTRVSGEEAKMWWSAIIGFGTYSYTNSTWKDYTWMRTGFSPRKAALSLYIMPGYNFENMQELLWKLWKYKAGRSCLSIKKLSDIDMEVLEEIIVLGLKEMKEKYG